MRLVPSAVTVVTAAGSQEARGTTISSFTSVSMKPPLISFNVKQGRQMHQVLRDASHFAVHILCDGHSRLGDHFAVPDRSGCDQLAAVSHHRDGFNTPILEDAIAVIRCRRYASYEAGDHSIIIGEVSGVQHLSESPPLLYYDRSYRKLGNAVSYG